MNIIPMKFLSWVFGLLLVLSVNYAYACGCGVPSQLDAFKGADSVFVGKVVRETQGTVEFEVTRSWKGVKTNSVVAFRVWDMGGCDRDIEWKSGKEYLIYSRPGKAGEDPLIKDPWILVDCERNGPLQDDRWIRIWGDPKDDIKKMNRIAVQAVTKLSQLDRRSRSLLRLEDNLLIRTFASSRFW